MGHFGWLAKHRNAMAILGVLVLGTAVRIGVVFSPETGHDADQQLFVVWARNLCNFGLGAFYSMTSFCNYPPLMLLVLWAIGEAVSLFSGVLTNDLAMRMVLKAPACLADLMIAVLLYRHGRKLFSANAGLAASALYYLNPVPMYVSAYWGQVDSIHSLLLLAGLMLIHRANWGLTGALSALAMLQKFQSISLLPLIMFEVYRIGRWRGVGRWLVGAVVATALVCAPFFFAGVLETALRRGYVEVVGQYNDVSRNAFNFWYLVAVPTTADTSVPPAIADIVAAGRPDFAANESWLLVLTWRHISLLLYSLTVALILSMYSLRPGLLARFAAAGALGLAFFMIPTEMHERYAMPVVALMVPWAVSGAWRERLYVFISAFLALNLAAVIPADEFAGGIAVMMSLGFAAMLGWLAVASFELTTKQAVCVPSALDSNPCVARNSEECESAVRFSESSLELESPTSPSTIIAWFRRLTAVATVIVLAFASFIAVRWGFSNPIKIPEGTLYVAQLKPFAVSQGWGNLRADRAVSGAVMRVGNRFHLRGIGTHAPSTIEYRLPEGYDEFRAVVGVDQATGGRGSIVVIVEVDGQVRHESETIFGSSTPVEIRIPISGASKLVLRADPTRDGTHFDHVDWAQARLVRKGLGSSEPDPGSLLPPATPPTGRR